MKLKFKLHQIHLVGHELIREMGVNSSNKALRTIPHPSVYNVRSYVLHAGRRKGNLNLINNFMMALAEEQIKAAFEQSEKEVTDLHSRISQGIREAKRNGTQIGLSKGTTLTTKKSMQCKAIIKKHSKDFGGTLDDPDVMKLCGCSRNSYYKYKREIKNNLAP